MSPSPNIITPDTRHLLNIVLDEMSSENENDLARTTRHVMDIILMSMLKRIGFVNNA